MTATLTILSAFLAVVAIVAWSVAAVTTVRLFRHRSGRLSLGAMAVRGMAWFDARNFQPTAVGLVRTLRLAFAVFFACVFLGITIRFVLMLNEA